MAEVEAGKLDAEMKEAEAAPEMAKEVEVDAPADKRPKLSTPVEIDMNDASINVMPSCDGKILMTLADGGLQYLCGAARANTGVKAGRYLFEVKIVEGRALQGAGNQRGPGQALHIGVTGAGSSLHLGENANSCCFDSDGCFMQGKWKTHKGKAFKPFDVVGLLINLDAKSSNANTASLFINGVRASDPQAIPESLHGKALFPTVNFKNMTLHLNFGADSLAQMPFTCRMVQDAAKVDVEVTAKKSGKKEILFPVGLPEEGTFRFLDGFLEENPGYTELSDRAIVSWARNSGTWPAKGQGFSNDRPGLDFGNQDMAEPVLRRSLATAASYYERNYVVMEVKNNLMAEERKKALEKYDGNTFKKVAVVAVGEPTKAFKAQLHNDMLAQKKWKVGSEVRKTKEAEAKKKAADKAAKEAVKKAKAAKAAKEKAQKEAEKKREADKKAAAAEAKKKKKEETIDLDDDAVEDLDEEEKAEEAEEKEEEPEKEESESEEEPEENIEDAVKKAEDAVELTAEEKACWFPKGEYAPHRDMSSKDLGSSFSSFSIPTKEEGFDEVRFVWANAKGCDEYLKTWIKEKKLTQRVEDLQPGSWFKEQQNEWQKLYDGWRKRQDDWKDPSIRDRKKAAASAKRKAEAKDGDESEGKENKENEEDEAMAEVDDDFDPTDIDAFDAEDVDDLGNGEPLYARFEYEDWTLLSLSFELHLLVHAFAADMNDPERSAFHESLAAFYFKKYFKKELNLKLCNCDTFAALLELIPDVVEVCQSNTLGPLLSNDSPMDNFVRVTEDMRRERLKAIEAGNKEAALKFDRRQAFQERGGGKGGRAGKGKQGDRSGYAGKPGPAGPGARAAMGPTARMQPTSRATYGAPAARSGYGQGPLGPPGHGPGHGPLGPPMYGGPGGYGPPPGYGGPPGYGPPPGYGMPPPGYGAPQGHHGGMSFGYGPPPGPGGPQGMKRGAYGMPGGMPAEKGGRGERGGYGGGGGRR